jgi:hypothetical protein
LLNKKDAPVLQGLHDYFVNFCSLTGSITNRVLYSNKTVCLKISNTNDIKNIVIRFFDLYPIIGIKKLDYEDFKVIHEIIISKKHLSVQGLTQILEIRKNMNQRRE